MNAEFNCKAATQVGTSRYHYFTLCGIDFPPTVRSTILSGSLHPHLSRSLSCLFYWGCSLCIRSASSSERLTPKEVIHKGKI